MSPNPPLQFLNHPDAFAPWEEARLVVLPVPYERTVSFGRGTSRGPEAILAASGQVELYDEELGIEPCRAGITTLAPLPLERAETAAMVAQVERAVEGIARAGKVPLILGGEHSISPPAVRAIARVAGAITVVQLDAHADLREEYQGDPMSHASAMARIRELAPAVQVGIRSLSDEEASRVRREKLPIFFAHAMHKEPRWMAQALRKISTDKIYITIDLDALDSSIMPATGTPEPGGMTWQQVTGFLNLLAREKNIVGFDMVELAPIPALHACNYLAAKLVSKCVGYWWTGRGGS